VVKLAPLQASDAGLRPRLVLWCKSSSCAQYLALILKSCSIWVSEVHVLLGHVPYAALSCVGSCL
jgi:hypothetical protein